MGNGVKRTPRILVIEDIESVRLLEMELLHVIGFERVDAATNGGSGMNKLESAVNTKDAFSLILCDWEMPKMSCIDLLKRVRKHKDLWHIPFYFVTGRIQEAT